MAKTLVWPQGRLRSRGLAGKNPFQRTKPNSKKNIAATPHGLYSGLPCAAILRFGQSGRKIHLGLTFFASFLGQAKKEGVTVNMQ